MATNKTFLQLQTYLSSRRGFSSLSKLKPHELVLAKDMINSLRDEIWLWKQWGFAGEKLQFTTVPPFSTGTISGTGGTTGITGDGTGWPATVEGVDLVGQDILINDKLYKIAARGSGTAITLGSNLTEDITAGTAYTIFFTEYAVNKNLLALRDVYRDITPISFRPESITPVDNEVGPTEFIFPAGQKSDVTPLLGVRPLPDTRYLIRVNYTFEPDEMTADGDITRLPNDTPMLRGIDVITTKWQTVGERGFINEVLFQDKKFKESLNVLNRRWTPNQRRMFVIQDRHVKANRFRNSNPWNR